MFDGGSITLEQALRSVAALFAIMGVLVFAPLLLDAHRTLRIARALGITNGRLIIARGTRRNRCMSLAWPLSALVALLPSLLWARQDFPVWLFPAIAVSAVIMQSLNILVGVLNHRDAKRLLASLEAEGGKGGKTA